MSTEVKMADKIKHLRLVAELEGSELGEYLGAIISMSDDMEYLKDWLVDVPEDKANQLVSVYTQVVDHCYDWVNKNFKVVETELTVTTKKYELEFLDTFDPELN